MQTLPEPSGLNPRACAGQPTSWLLPRRAIHIWFRFSSACTSGRRSALYRSSAESTSPPQASKIPAPGPRWVTVGWASAALVKDASLGMSLGVLWQSSAVWCAVAERACKDANVFAAAIGGLTKRGGHAVRRISHQHHLPAGV